MHYMTLNIDSLLPSEKILFDDNGVDVITAFRINKHVHLKYNIKAIAAISRIPKSEGRLRFQISKS